MNLTFSEHKPIAIGTDHAGFEHKNNIHKWLLDLGYMVKDYGTNSIDSIDYPDIAHPVATSVQNGEASFGILLCGSGVGVSIVANKHPSVRAALCWCNDIAKLARQHNDANIICLPARFITLHEAKRSVETFMYTAFEGGRHVGRVRKINCC